jgi:hypothetical protein
MAVIAGIGVQDVHVVDFVETMLLGMGAEHVGDSGVESRSQ